MRNYRFPVGVKPLNEIITYPVADQTVFLVTLMEYLLRQFHRDAFECPLTDLIAMHADKLSTRVHELHKARWVRNQVIHATGKASSEEIQVAASALRQTASELLALTDFDNAPAMAAVA